MSNLGVSMDTIRLINFKGFEDTGDLSIKPITILIGPNSSGKSSFIQPLLMLKQTVDSRDVTSPLVVNGSYVKLSSYENFVKNHDIDKEFGIQLSFIPRSSLYFPRKITEQGAGQKSSVRLKSSFIYNKSKKRIELSLTEIDFDSKNIKIERIKLKKSVRYEAITKSFITNSELQPIVFPRVTPFKFFSYSLKERERLVRNSKFMDARRSRYFSQNIVEDVINDLHYIGPLRENPKSIYISGGELRRDVGLKGEYAADVLWTQGQGIRRARTLLDRVNHWINKFGLGSKVSLKPLGKHSGFFQIVITNPQSNINATICDVGFGVSQVLPLIVEGFYSNSNSTLLIEQPEIHLHPKVQADLGDLLIELIKVGRKVIVETHSEHLISRLTRRIAEENDFTKDKLAIYYFTCGKEGTSIDEIKIDNLGRFENWPDGFFEENYTEALIHNKVIAERLGA
jgi:predicted ATPase